MYLHGHVTDMLRILNIARFHLFTPPIWKLKVNQARNTRHVVMMESDCTFFLFLICLFLLQAPALVHVVLQEAVLDQQKVVTFYFF